MNGNAADTIDRYRTRLRRVLDHVDAHLDEPLDLDRLSAVAAFSKHHFHRQFTAAFGLTLARYVQLARLKRASLRLALGSGESVTAVGLDAGYDAPDAFARAFRRRVGQAPSDFRAAPDWVAWRATFEPFHQARNKLMSDHSINDVTIRTVPTVRVATMTHIGHPDTIDATVRRLIDWRLRHGLTADTSTSWNVFPTDTRVTPADEFRMELCVGTDGSIEPDGEDIVEGEIPGGRVAVLRLHRAAAEDLADPALFLYRDWLPASGEALRDFPLYCQRIAFVPLVPEEDAVTDLFLPLR